MGYSADLTIREFRAGPAEHPLTGLIAYVEGMSSGPRIERVLETLMVESAKPELGPALRNKDIEVLGSRLVPVGGCRSVSSLGEVVMGVANAEVAIILEGFDTSLLADLRDPPRRAITEPSVEPVSRGPKESFTETVRMNVAMVRRRLPHPALRLQRMSVGRLSRTETVVAWLEGMADPAVVRAVVDRIRRVKIDGISDSSFIEEFIEDSPLSPFPQVKYTERPERVASDLLEGRVAIFVDGTPMVLVVPTTFWSALEAGDDNFERPHIVSLIRLVRFMALAITIFGPGLFVALTTIHQEMIPTSLALVIASGREPIPFPAIIEALIMELIFEILREAGLRLPRVVGGAVSIVGPLVLGEAAVTAGLISPFMVIVVALTAMASSTIPNPSAANILRLLRFPILLLAGTLGLFGIMWGLIALSIHLVTLRSFGAPYLEPVIPLRPASLKGIILRLPRWMLTGRSRALPSLAADQTRKGGGPDAV